MADAFGVSPAWLDGELADYIAGGRLAARIDRVAGVVVTTRPNRATAAYQKLIKQGDAFLNRLQKLARVINTE